MCVIFNAFFQNDSTLIVYYSSSYISVPLDIYRLRIQDSCAIVNPGKRLLQIPLTLPKLWSTFQLRSQSLGYLKGINQYGYNHS